MIRVNDGIISAAGLPVSVVASAISPGEVVLAGRCGSASPGLGITIVLQGLRGGSLHEILVIGYDEA